jgi:PEP-CTERM motif
MNTCVRVLVACAGLLLVVASKVPSALANTPLNVNLLANPGFENGPGSVSANFVPVLTYPNPTTGQWAAESSFVEGTDPNWGQLVHSGSYMMAMNGPGTSDYSQAWQNTAITGDVGDTVTVSAWFAAPQPGSVAIVDAFCFDANGNQVGTTIGQGAALSASNTWTEFSYSGTIPANTSYILTQVAYENATRVDGGNSPFAGGFVDDTSLTITPEPGTLTLLGTGAVALVGYRWHRRRAAKSAAV